MHVSVLSLDSDNSTVHLTLENQGDIRYDVRGGKRRH